jgi:uncharacterized protein YqeY
LSLKETITSDLKTAMKAQDKQRLSVIRMMLSEIKYAQAAVSMASELPDAEVLKVVTTYHKRLSKSLEDFPEGEKRDQIRAEIAIVETYLPKKASEAEIATVVAKVMAATEDRTFGTLMKQVMAELGPSADGKLVSQLLKAKLS